jgi:ribulose bisphosphate carboxylase small subunit
MSKQFRIMPAKYVVVSYNYTLEIPGTTGTKEQTYWIVVPNFEKKSVEDALMKFGVEAAKALPQAEYVKVLAVNCREIKEDEYKLN